MSHDPLVRAVMYSETVNQLCPWKHLEAEEDQKHCWCDVWRHLVDTSCEVP